MTTACGKPACSTTKASGSPSSTSGDTVKGSRRATPFKVRRPNRHGNVIQALEDVLGNAQVSLDTWRSCAHTSPQCHSPATHCSHRCPFPRCQCCELQCPTTILFFEQRKEFVHPFSTEFFVNSCGSHPTFRVARRRATRPWRTDTAVGRRFPKSQRAIQSANHLPRQLSSRRLQRKQGLPSSQFRLGRIVIDVRGDGCGGHFSYVMSRSNINTSCVLSVHVNTGRCSSSAPPWNTSSSTSSPTLISATVQFPSSSATREMTRASNHRSVRSLLACEYRSSSSKSDLSPHPHKS